MNIESLIEMYLNAKQGAWSQSTLASESLRLRGLARHLDGNPATLWHELERRKLAGYTRVTVWTRVTDFYNWCIKRGHKSGLNQYELYREEKAQWFKVSRVYQPKHVTLTLEEAKRRILTMPEGMREKALQLLEGGLRFSESRTVEAGWVVGKGGKAREVFVAPVESDVSYRTFLRALKKHTGLTPHQLRKIMATQCARSGMHEADLCSMFGWVSFATAHKYVAPVRTEQLAEKVRQIHQGRESNEYVFKAVPVGKRAG